MLDLDFYPLQGQASSSKSLRLGVNFLKRSNKRLTHRAAAELTGLASHVHWVRSDQSKLVSQKVMKDKRLHWASLTVSVSSSGRACASLISVDASPCERSGLWSMSRRTVLRSPHHLIHLQRPVQDPWIPWPSKMKMWQDLSVQRQSGQGCPVQCHPQRKQRQLRSHHLRTGQLHSHLFGQTKGH